MIIKEYKKTCLFYYQYLDKIGCSEKCNVWSNQILFWIFYALLWIVILVVLFYNYISIWKGHNSLLNFHNRAIIIFRYLSYSENSSESYQQDKKEQNGLKIKMKAIQAKQYLRTH